jgi:hypothetical protein
MRWLQPEGLTMDAKVYSEAPGIWHVNAFPTMRSLGEVMRQPDTTLKIRPERGSDLEGVAPGPCPSIKEVADAIAVHLGGQCSVVGRGGF